MKTPKDLLLECLSSSEVLFKNLQLLLEMSPEDSPARFCFADMIDDFDYLTLKLSSLYKFYSEK